MDHFTLRYGPAIEPRPPSPPEGSLGWDLQPDTQPPAFDLASSMAGLTVEPDLSLNENMKALFLARVMEKARKLILRRVKEKKVADDAELDDFKLDVEHCQRCYHSIFHNLPASFDTWNNDNTLAVLDRQKLHAAIQEALKDVSDQVFLLVKMPRRTPYSELNLAHRYSAQIVTPAVCLEVMDREYQRRMYSDVDPVNFDELRAFWLQVAQNPQDVMRIRKVVRRAKLLCKKWDDGAYSDFSSVLWRALWFAKGGQVPMV
ncbi:hypothetical protein CGCSCA5_v011257 [Colletotrichum siamense]|nr:hypothetical protein CGCSCA5_v011257 [Colletotrichum siamense]KAI8200790.1 hypothetical protein KHU50_006539 [Colletotrichum sp. SAR 10_65]KAI8258926.1 hypothetical protein K4K53_003987 [Colletotrichum sp. SAR 10_77]